MKTTSYALTAALLASSASAHMYMKSPAAFRTKENPNAAGNVDYNMVAPLSPDGSNFPCKGYHSDFGTPAGASVATYAPGSSQNIVVTGGANHNGGSCQVSLSYDSGKTFKVITSIIGDCPASTGDNSIPFTVPSDAPSGDVILSWSWINKVGGQPEFYQNCAAVTIGGAKKRDGMVPVKRAAAFSSRPDMFVANVGNGCKAFEGVVAYPNPGPDVVQNTQDTKPPTGNCQAAAPGGGASGPSDGPKDTPKETPKETKPEPAPAPSQAAPSQAPGGAFKEQPAPTPSPITPAPAPVGGDAKNGEKSGEKPSAPAAEPSAAPKPSEPAKTEPAPVTGGAAAPAGAQAAGSKCTEEGAWNCIDGKSYQRCGSGMWTAVMQMSAGTQCNVGQGSEIKMSAIQKRFSPRRRVTWDN